MACVKVELLRQNRKAGATLSAMNKITAERTVHKKRPYDKTCKKQNFAGKNGSYRLADGFIRKNKRNSGKLAELNDRVVHK